MSMSRLSTLMLMKKLASQNFRLGAVVFNGFDNIKHTESVSVVDTDEDSDQEDVSQLEIWADMSIKFEGQPPDSYRVLNAIVMDWVDEHEEDLKGVINSRLREFVSANYPDVDLSDMDENFDDYIWEDQVDYYPEIDEENNFIHFTLELVLEIEDDEIGGADSDEDIEDIGGEDTDTEKTDL